MVSAALVVLALTAVGLAAVSIRQGDDPLLDVLCACACLALILVAATT